MRLFVAVNLKAREKEMAHRAVERLAKLADKGRFTRRENLHITLAFLGETRREAAARSALDTVEAVPFSLELKGFGRFGKKGEICWMGVEDSSALVELQKRVQAALERQGFPADSRPFHPHLTLGRQVSLPPEREGLLALEPVPVEVDAVSLMLSHRVDEKLTYTEIAVRTCIHNKETPDW